MEYGDLHAIWYMNHLKRRRGERKRRLKHGHREPEQLLLERILFPLFQSLDWFHPEYEIKCYDERPFFLDFAYIRDGLKLNFELDGYGAHQRDVDRYQFARERRRDILLMAHGWRVFRFAYDDVVKQPERLKRLIQLVLGSYLDHESLHGLSPDERAILQFGLMQKDRIFKAIDAQQITRKGRYHTHRALQKLVELGVIEGVGVELKRVYRYRVNVEHAAIVSWLRGVA